MLRAAACLALISIALAGCGGGASSLSGITDKPETAPVADGSDLGLAGRWILAAPNAPSCGVTFTGTPSATEGRVMPEGGCPERFFLAHRWRLADGTLTVLDNEDASLATFRNGGDRFAGQSSAGTTLTLSR